VTDAGRGVTSAGRSVTWTGRSVTAAGQGVAAAGRSVTEAACSPEAEVRLGSEHQPCGNLCCHPSILSAESPYVKV
jgi:hypothetical protein